MGRRTERADREARSHGATFREPNDDSESTTLPFNTVGLSIAAAPGKAEEILGFIRDVVDAMGRGLIESGEGGGESLRRFREVLVW